MSLMVDIHGKNAWKSVGYLSRNSPVHSSYLTIISRPVYSSFGYVVEGSDFLQDIKEGDVIVSAKVTEGLEYLKQP
jgi:cyclophilin family peptidyl-prolyl cis-trans isomerase